MTDPWADAKIKFRDEIMPRLERNGQAIGDSASRGEVDAIEIIRLYKMLYRSFDPMTSILLEEALDRWMVKPV